jgi:hypothetical protein
LKLTAASKPIRRENEVCAPALPLEERRLAFADDPESESACVANMPMPDLHAYARLEAELRETHEYCTVST